MTPRPDTFAEQPLLDALATGVIRLDDGLRVEYLNSAAEQILSLSLRKSLGQRLTRLLALPDSLFARLREAIENGQPCTDRQVSIGTLGHEPVLVDCSISPFRSERLRQGLLLELTAIERPMRIARDEAMLVQQEHARSLLRSLAHEIKNPLGGLRGAAQLLERQLDDDSLVEYTDIIIREADRLRALLDRMLGPVSRPRRDPINLHEVIERVRKITRASAPTGVQVRFDYDPSIPECLSDRDRLVQVMLNITGNALHAVGDSGSLLLRTRVRHNVTLGGQRLRLVAAVEVRDDGPGVPDDLIDQIFYPMVTGTANGTGLGLSIAQSTMHQLGGSIEVRSAPGDTVFTVLVPLDTDADHQPDTRAA